MANFLINLRAVHPNDKAMAIGFELFLAGLLANIPGKVLYKFVSGDTFIPNEVTFYFKIKSMLFIIFKINIF